MKKTFLTSSLIVFGLWLQAQAAPLAGLFSINPPGSWSEFLQGGQPGRVGNEINAWGPNYRFAGATIAVVTNDITGEWDWITKYENGTLFLTNAAGAPWFNSCEGEKVFEVSFPEVWVKTRSTRYASTNAGYLEFLLTAANDSVRVKATYAGLPTYTQEATGVLASDNLGTASIGIGKEVAVEIMPKKFNVESQGVLPVTVSTCKQFNVKAIDPASLKLECAPALRGVVSGERQGVLVLKFDRQAVVANLPPVTDGEEIKLVLTGQLKDGTPISGSDEVIILKKDKKEKPNKPAKK
jgi:hypothetical protein